MTAPESRHDAGPPAFAVCRKAGFRLLGEAAFEVANGRVLHANDWVADLVATAR